MNERLFPYTIYFVPIDRATLPLILWINKASKQMVLPFKMSFYFVQAGQISSHVSITLLRYLRLFLQNSKPSWKKKNGNFTHDSYLTSCR